jgi:hypothetical protein
MYVKTGGSNCPALPHQPNPIKGVDTLQCELGADETHLWPYPETSVVSFSYTTNPSTKLYVTNAVAPHDSQAVNSWLCLTTESFADSFISGKEMVKVVVNIGCGLEPEGPGGGGAPAIGDGRRELQVVLATTGAGVAFDIIGDLRGFERLELYAPTGRIVRSLPFGETSKEGDHATVTWDHRDGAGSRVANGVYFYRLRGPRGTAASGGFVLVR